MSGKDKSKVGTTGRRRGEVKHVQQTRVADGEGREEPFTRGKQQKVAEKKEARPNVEKMKVQKKGSEKRRGSR